MANMKPSSQQIAADVGRRLRHSIADLEVERATLAELGLALDDYRDHVSDRVLAICIMLGRLRLEAGRYEWWAGDTRRAA
jgi:hypothetical protein